MLILRKVVSNWRFITWSPLPGWTVVNKVISSCYKPENSWRHWALILVVHFWGRVLISEKQWTYKYIISTYSSGVRTPVSWNLDSLRTGVRVSSTFRPEDLTLLIIFCIFLALIVWSQLLWNKDENNNKQFTPDKYEAGKFKH